VVECHHGRASGGGTGDLDRVLDGFGTAVEQDGARRMVDRSKRIQPLTHLDIRLVRAGEEAGVGEPAQLRGGTLDDPGTALPTVVTAIPLPKSMNEFWSTSTTTPPLAASTNTGSDDPAPAGRAAHPVLADLLDLENRDRVLDLAPPVELVPMSAVRSGSMRVLILLADRCALLSQQLLEPPTGIAH
jgi:hypothetical protein